IASDSGRFFKHFRFGADRYRLTVGHFSSEVLNSGSELFNALKQLDRQVGKLQFKSDGISHLSDRIEALLSDLQIFLDEKKEDKQYIYWAEQRRQGVFLHCSPLDVAPILRDRLYRGEIPTIMTSATLSTEGSFDFIKERMGIDQADEVILDTIFDYEKQSLFYLPTHLPRPSDQHFLPAISEEIVLILQASQGRAFLLFTSWKNLEAVYALVSARLPYRLLKQGEQPKQVLIERFREDLPSVLFGTTSFWQGVDVEGEALSCVIIDKLPFASPSDPLTAARIEAIAKSGKEPFSSFQVPVAILALRQGIGRLIRNSRDRGLVTILDKRITTKDYGRQFLSSLPAAPRTRDFDDVAKFFK
ncbi:ATP-dependent DNA helicase, partial [Nitrospira defluvii]|nr:ATP-dependent DNA helicase [Nitrospira defluvii]